MRPITKNIIVVDEQGNEYEATYPKRAKGLVKNGRARFIAENKICLACPPNKFLEDNIVNNHSNFDSIEINKRVNQILQENPQADIGKIIRQEVARDAAQKMSENAPVPKAPTLEPQASGDSAKFEQTVLDAPELSMEFILLRIDKILNDTAYIHEAIGHIKEAKSDSSWNHAQGRANIVEARKKKNQKKKKKKKKMYDDLKPKDPSKEPSGAVRQFQQLADSLRGLPPNYTKEILEEAARTMFAQPWDHE